MSAEQLRKELDRRRNADDILGQFKPKYLSKEERTQLAAAAATAIATTNNKESISNYNSMPMEWDAQEQQSLSEADRKLIKRQYMGMDVGGHKSRRTDRQVNFDWDLNDDTSREEPLLLNPTTQQKQQSATSRPASRAEAEREAAVCIKSIDEFGNEIEIMRPNVNKKKLTIDEHQMKEQHWNEKTLEQLQERDWRIMREDFGISVSGGNIPPPLRYWDEAPFPRRLTRIIDELGYEEPTAIQRQAIPIILSGRDLIGIAETGSGKTAAFMLPMICQILRLPPMNEESKLDGPYGLVLAPTRELVQQIEQEAKKFCNLLGLRCLSIVGGHSMAEQSVQMRKGAEIVIATPGRLRDCLEQHVLALAQCVSLVLDEADRMIDMNFEDDLNFILLQLPASMAKPDGLVAEDPQSLLNRQSYRQTTMFSATMPSSVEVLARSYLSRPATVTVGMAGQAADTVEQQILMLKEEEKDRRLLDTLQNERFAFPIIIFVNQKRTVDFLSRRLETLGYRCVSLHGGKTQEQREMAIAAIRRHNKDILIATDVAGRGIDIPNVSLVLNYDMAKSISEYIHRIGRTGRMGKTGTAISFVSAHDVDIYWDLKMVLRRASKKMVPSEFWEHEATRNKPGEVVTRKRHEERIFAYGV